MTNPSNPATTTPVPRSLTADGRRDPIGVPSPRPTLAWKMDGASPSLGYTVRASHSSDVRGDETPVFDIHVESTAAPRLEWPTAPLASRERLWWAVGAKRPHGIDWSEVAVLEAPLWTESDWAAGAITDPAWLTPGSTPPDAYPELAIEFDVPSAIVTARLYFTASGIAVPELNGEQAIPGRLEPGYSVQDAGTPASAWDITDRLLVGRNSLAITIGGGIAYVPHLPDRYTKYDDTSRPLWVRARVEIACIDGTVVNVAAVPM